MTDLSKMRVLLTGGAGLIGSALLWELNRLGNTDVTVADFLGDEDRKWRHLRPLQFADYLEADDLLDRLASGDLGTFDLVLHLGACSSTTEKDSAYLIRNNFEFTKELGEYCDTTGARFVYASSAATYGAGENGMSDDSSLDYLRTLRPLNMYGYSKHLYDLYAAENGLLETSVGLKYFNVFGPNEDHKGDMRSVVNKAVEQITATGSLRLFKSYRDDYKHGEQRRDFLYVKHAAKMTLHLAASDTNGLFNIGSGVAHTWNELASATFAALGKPQRIEYIEMPEEMRPKYQYYTMADITRLHDTGYSASGDTFRADVTEYVCGYIVPGKALGE